jgi:hypothetical protein
LTFGGGTLSSPYSLEKTLYIANPIGAKMYLNRIRASDGAIQWSMGFDCTPNSIN